LSFAEGDGEVELEELGEEVVVRAEAVGVEDGGVEGGVGVLEGGLAGELEGVRRGSRMRVRHQPQLARSLEAAYRQKW
jgi:hypothetical protein